jgi:hypothetical protein
MAFILSQNRPQATDDNQFFFKSALDCHIFFIARATFFSLYFSPDFQKDSQTKRYAGGGWRLSD